jgi:hypothetical protein
VQPSSVAIEAVLDEIIRYGQTIPSSQRISCVLPGRNLLLNKINIKAVVNMAKFGVRELVEERPCICWLVDFYIGNRFNSRRPAKSATLHKGVTAKISLQATK